MRYVRGFVPVALTMLLPLLGAAASPNAVSPIRPLQTELLLPLDIARIHPGSAVLVRVDLDWTDGSCTLRAGSVVQGHIVRVVRRTKGVKDSQVQVVFDAADCGPHHESVVAFDLVALVGPTPSNSSWSSSGPSEAPPLADAVGNAIGGAGGIRSAVAASAINSSAADTAPRMPMQILPGHVIDIRKTVLGLGDKAGEPATITGVGHDLRLEQGTSLILTRAAAALPEHTADTKKGFSMSATGGGGSELASTSVGEERLSPAQEPAAAAPEFQDMSETCSGACSVVQAKGLHDELPGSSAVASVDLRRLGFAPHEQRELQALNHETTITFLDDANLLCTFDPHRMRERDGRGEEAVRRITAVLINPQSHAIERVMQWRVRGEGQYLWRLTAGRVLVRTGHDLEVLDAKLTPLHSIPVQGPVAWVTSSPSGDHIAVGTIRERYSNSIREALEQALPSKPEEDVAVRVFDRDFDVVATALQSSTSAAPVLSDTGELRLRGDGHTHWKVSEYRWDRTEVPITTMRSTCHPTLSTPEHGLIFAVGCTTSGRWFRMLRKDGYALLKGESPSDEIEQAAEGAAEGAFAVRVLKAVRSMTYGQPFRRSDLLLQRISVYRSSDGQSLTTVNVSDFGLSDKTFALSPSAEQIALVGHDSILFYAVVASRK